MTVAEVEEIVPVGSLDPHAGPHAGDLRRPDRRRGGPDEGHRASQDEERLGLSLTREQMAQRAAAEIKDGYYVNLGIGIPTLCANFIPPGIRIMLQSENGLMGIGPYPTEDEIDADLINAGKETVTTMPGASFFSSAQSFAMIRGGTHRSGHPRSDAGLEGRGSGELDDPGRDGQGTRGSDGPGDRCAKQTLIVMDHLSKKGDKKILDTCTLPLTGKGVVNTIVSSLAVIRVEADGTPSRRACPGSHGGGDPSGHRATAHRPRRRSRDDPDAAEGRAMTGSLRGAIVASVVLLAALIPVRARLGPAGGITAGRHRPGRERFAPVSDLGPG